jgi:hypothetical protein
MSAADHRQRAEELLKQNITAAAQVHALLAIEDHLAALVKNNAAINEVVDLLGPERASREFHEAQRLMGLRKAGM